MIFINFFSAAYVDEQLKAIPISNNELAGNKIFETPIIIVPGKFNSGSQRNL